MVVLIHNPLIMQWQIPLQSRFLINRLCSKSMAYRARILKMQTTIIVVANIRALQQTYRISRFRILNFKTICPVHKTD